MYPKYLYHYTTLETLALILEHRKLRFTLLSKLNDPLEGKTQDLRNVENLVYCSSWTTNPVDTIPMWKMYTDLKGVRLKVKTESVFNSGKAIENGKFGSVDSNYTNLDQPISAKLSSPAMRNIYIDKVFGPQKVEYAEYGTSNYPKVTHTVTAVEGNKLVQNDWVKLDGVGLHKDFCWVYEQEWRFRLMSSPSFVTKNHSAQDFCRLVQFENKNIDVPLSNNFFEDLEVTMGPLCNPAHRILIEGLCSKYNIEIRVLRSKIEIK